MTDNFEFIYNFIKNQNVPDGWVYQVQLIQRRKDKGNELMKKGEKLIEYFLVTKDNLIKYKEKIIKLCNTFNCRAYINLNAKSLKSVSLQLIYETAEQMGNNEFRNPKDTINHIVGKLPPSIEKTVLIDIDNNAVMGIDELTAKVTELLKTPNLRNLDKVCFDIIDSVSGKHIISQPFNKNLFTDTAQKAGFVYCNDEFCLKDGDNLIPAFCIKTNAPTILYAL